MYKETELTKAGAQWGCGATGDEDNDLQVKEI
jgi:hypothetical protein